MLVLERRMLILRSLIKDSFCKSYGLPDKFLLFAIAPITEDNIAFVLINALLLWDMPKAFTCLMLLLNYRM